MKIKVRGKNLEITPSLKNYINEKLAPLAKFVKRLDISGGTEIWVEVDRVSRHHKSGDVFRAVADLRLPKKILRAEKEAENVRMAIDVLKNKLILEIEKYKTRLSDIPRRRSGD